MKRDITTIRKLGNSLGVILPQHAIRAHGLKRGDEVRVSIHEHGIVLLTNLPIIK